MKGMMVGEQGMEEHSTVVQKYEPPRFARIGNGWERDTIKQHIQKMGTYDEFGGEDDFEAFLDDITVDGDDYRQWKEQHAQVDWYHCGHCEEEIAELREQGDHEAAADIDPEYQVLVRHTTYPIDLAGRDMTRVEEAVEAYCGRHKEDGAVFEYTHSWREDR